jgi:hypothetical protein
LGLGLPFSSSNPTQSEKSSGSSLESREYGCRDPSRWPCGTSYPQKLALTSPTSGGRSVGRVRSRIQGTELFLLVLLYKVGRTPWTGDQPVARPLPTQRTIQTQNKGTQTSMIPVGFELMIFVLERAKTVHASDRAATVIGKQIFSDIKWEDTYQAQITCY